MMKKLLLIVMFILTFPILSFGERVEFKNGNVLNVDIVAQDGNYIEVLSSDVKITYWLDEIKSIDGMRPENFLGIQFDDKADDALLNYENNSQKIEGKSYQVLPTDLNQEPSKDKTIVQNVEQACQGEDVEGCYQKAGYLFKKGQTAEASKLLDVVCNEGFVKGCLVLANIYYENNNESKARFFYELACSGGLMQGCSNIGIFLQGDYDFKQSMLYFDKACQGGYRDACDYREVTAYFVKGLDYLEHDQYNLAIEAFTETVYIDPEFMVAYFERGNAYMDMGNYKKAIEDFNIWLDHEPDDGGCFENRAAAYINLGQFNQASQDVQKAQELGLSIRPEILEALERTQHAF